MTIGAKKCDDVIDVKWLLLSKNRNRLSCHDGIRSGEKRELIKSV